MSGSIINEVESRYNQIEHYPPPGIVELLNRMLLLLPVVIAWPLAAFATVTEYELAPSVILDVAVLPEPETCPIPDVKSRYFGTELEIKFIVDKAGKPSQILLSRPLVSYSDVHLMTFAAQMREMVTHRKFSPAEDAQGNPLRVGAVLPIRVVRNGKAPAVMAGLLLDTKGGTHS